MLTYQINAIVIKYVYSSVTTHFFVGILLAVAVLKIVGLLLIVFLQGLILD